MFSEKTSPPTQPPTLETIATQAEANPAGDIFGGWMMGQMDLAGGSRAYAYVGHRVVTAGVADLSFLKPVFMGDHLRFYTEIGRIGTTSITILVEGWVNRQGHGPLEKVTEARYTFVSVDQNFRPTPIAKPQKDET